MSAGNKCTFILAFVKSRLGDFNLFETGSQEEQILVNERRTTRVYLILLITSIVLLTFYYCITSTTTIIVVESPTFSQYSSLVQHSSLQCFCSSLAVKYEYFVQIEPTYHEVCRSDFVSDGWINRLFTLYDESRSEAILSDFYRIGVFQFRTLRSLCQLAEETITNDIRRFAESEFIQTLLIEEELFHSQIDSIFTMFIDSIHTKFLRALRFMQDTTAQSLIFTGAAVTSLQPKYTRTINTNGVGLSHYGIEYHFADGSSCVCSPSTATTCMGLATFNNQTVPGFQTGCYMLSALLKSTLEAFYNQAFIEELIDSSETFHPLNSSGLNQTIEMLLSQMFVTHWSKTALFQQYYNRCAPDSCQYTLRERQDFLNIVTLLVGLFGGLSSVLTIVAPLLTTTLWPILWKFAARRHRVQNDPVVALPFYRRMKHLFRLLKQTAIELNLFERSPQPTRKQRYITRVYLTSFFIIVLIITISTSMRPQLVSINIPSPTMSTFIQLSSQYPLTLDCPCSQAAIPYSRFISNIKPEYHAVCTSDLISPQWINISFRQTSGEKILTYDIRYQFPFYFQLLSTLCRVARQTIDESLQSFYQTELVTTRLFSQEAFRNQTDVIVNQFQRTVPESFQRTIEVIRTNSEINQFITSVNSEFRSYTAAGRAAPAILKYASFPSFTNPQCRRQESALNPCACFPLSYYTCYFPSIIPVDETKSTIPGIFQTWFPLQALLESTLECFYNVTCLSQVIDLINSTATSINITSLNVRLPSSSKDQDERIELLANRLFVEAWKHNSSFASYFDQCRPLSCQYSYTTRLNLIFIITSIVGLIGGVNIALRLLTPPIVSGTIQVWNGVRDPQLRMVPRQLTLHNLLHTAFISITRTVIELNLFASIPVSIDPKIIRRGRWITRIYLLLLTAALFIVVLYASFQQETITETIRTPSLLVYDNLYQQYPSTLRCPCSHTAIKYAQFTDQIQPHFHEVCNSVFVTSEWIESLQNPSGGPAFSSDTDFRLTIRMQFQILSKLCKLSQNIINTSLIVMLQTDLISSTVLSPNEFSLRTISSIEQFKRSTASQLLQTIEQMQIVNDGNQLATVTMTNWRFFYKPLVTEQEKTYQMILPVRTQPKIDGMDNCTCGLRSDCARLSDFDMQTSNESSRVTLPGFLSGCLLLDSFLQSTLTCLYNQTCLDLMRAAIFYMTPIPFQTLTDFSSWSPNTTVRSIFSQLFVQQWDEKMSFARYYNACAPKSCQYSYTMQHNRAFVLATLIALFGGLTKGLRFAIRFLMTIVYKLIDRRKNRITVAPAGQIATIVNISEEHIDPQRRRQGILVFCCLSVLITAVIVINAFIWFAGKKTESESFLTSTVLTTMNSETNRETTTTSINRCSLTHAYDTGSGPKTLITNDFNGDSFLDFAVTNSLDDTLTILLGNGDGTFQTKQVYPMKNGSHPWGIAAADFNNDTVLDLAITLSGSSEVAVLFGVADDRLFSDTPHFYSYYRKESVPGEIQVGDLNDDGFVDLVVCILPDQSSTGFSIYLNQGEMGRFEEAILGFDYLVNDVISVAIGDFDHNGRDDDLASIDIYGETMIINSINFSSINGFYEIRVDMYANPSMVIKGRFNWDNWDDLALISSQSDTLQILLAYDDRTFSQHIYLTDKQPTSVARIGLNGDLVVLSCNRTISVFLGTEIGLFQRVNVPWQIDRNISGECARSLVVGDFNRDGNDDVAFIDTEVQKIRVVLFSFNKIAEYIID